MASADTLKFTVHGRQTHGAAPCAGVDPIVTAAQVVLGLQTVVSRSIDITREPAVVTIGANLSPLDQWADLTAAAHVDDAQRSFFRAPGRHAQRHLFAVGRRHVVVDGVGFAGALRQHFGVEQQPFLALQSLAHDQLELVVLGCALFKENQLTGQPRHLDYA